MLDLAHARVLPPGSAVPVRTDTDARFGSLALLRRAAGVEYGSLWPRSPLRSCHRPTDACPAPIPLAHTAARSVRTAPRTASIPETVHAGFSKMWSDAGSPDRSPDR